MTTDLRPLSAIIAAEVRAEMARQGLTQQELADRLGVRQWWVSRRVGEPKRGTDSKPRTEISAAEVVVIADALDVPTHNLLAPAARSVAQREAVAA